MSEVPSFRQEYQMGKSHSLQQVVLGKFDSCMKINEVRTYPHTMPQYKLKMAYRLKYKTRLSKTPKENTGKRFSDKA